MTEKQNNMVVQHPDKRLMERIRSLERNERIRLHIAQMKCNGYTDNECKTLLRFPITLCTKASIPPRLPISSNSISSV